MNIQEFYQALEERNSDELRELESLRQSRVNEMVEEEALGWLPWLAS